MYPPSLANSITVCGCSTPSKCSCKRTLGRLCNNFLSSFIERSFSQRRDQTPRLKRCKIIHRISNSILPPEWSEPEWVRAPMYNPTPMQLEEKSQRMMEAAAKNPPTTDYGLRHEILSLMETLAQSVSTMAPTTTPAATIAPSPAMGHGWPMRWQLQPCCSLPCALAAMLAIPHRQVRCTP